MNISIDFDETYTRDPEFWNYFLETCKSYGHEVWCITLRSEAEGAQVLATIGKKIGNDRCFFTNREPKRAFAWSKGVRIDIWIDDMPMVIDAKVFTL